MTSAAAPKPRHVVPNPGRGWVVVRQVTGSLSIIGPDQVEAVRTARKIARRQGGGEVIVHRPDGRIEAGDTDPHARGKRQPLAATQGAAMIFDFLGVMHPGCQQAADPWAAAADDVADAWRSVADLLDESLNEFRDDLRTDVGSPVR